MSTESRIREVLQRSLSLEADVLALLARSLNGDFGSAEYAARTLARLPSVRRKLAKAVLKYGDEVPAEVRATIAEAYREGRAAAEREVARAGAAWSQPFTVQPSTAAIAALEAQLGGAVQSSLPAILRAADDAYRDVVAEVVARSLAGEFTRRQAAQAALDRFGDMGLKVAYAGGRRMSIASYMEMACRTAAANAQRQATVDTFAAGGYDLVRLTDVPGECALCRPYEGRKLSLRGETPGVTTVAEARANGLFHPGCRHTLTLWVEGLSSEKTGTVDPAGDAARQQQRYLERGIRKWKLREAAAMDDTARAAAKAKQRVWQARLREHVDATGGKRLRYREQVKRAV